MKKNVLTMIMVCLIIGTAGCGKKEVPEQTSVPVQEEETEVPEAEEQEDKTSGKEFKALAGVYSIGETLVEIPMGTCFEGEQKEFVYVQIPENYLIGAGYSLGNQESEGFEMAMGADLVKDAVENGLLEQEYKVSSLLLGQTANGISEKLRFELMTRDAFSFDDVKEIAGDYKELPSETHEAIYYVDSSEYATSDLTFCYSVNDDIILWCEYEGPLADEIGLDQLAQNIYDLVEVIE